MCSPSAQMSHQLGGRVSKVIMGTHSMRRQDLREVLEGLGALLAQADHVAPARKSQEGKLVRSPSPHPQAPTNPVPHSLAPPGAWWVTQVLGSLAQMPSHPLPLHPGAGNQRQGVPGTEDMAFGTCWDGQDQTSPTEAPLLSPTVQGTVSSSCFRPSLESQCTLTGAVISGLTESKAAGSRVRRN